MSKSKPTVPNPSLTISAALRWGTSQLQSHFSNANRESALILQYVLDTTDHPLLLPPSTPLTPRQINQFKQLIQKRRRHTPFAYIIGQIIFYGLDLKVTPDALIPRPETEILVELALHEITQYGHPTSLRLAEIGTGSGAIALTLAHCLPNLRLTATDISPAALAVARANIEKYHLEQRITLLQGDLLQPFPPQSLDFIVANLPYVPSNWLNYLETDIIDYEPHLALDGGPDGLNLINQLLHQTQTKLRPHGTILLEIWHDQAAAIKKLALTLFPKANITIKQDLAHLDRFVIIRTK